MLTNIQKNIIDEMANAALLQLKLMDKYSAIVQLYGAESLSSVTDADMLTLAELTGAKNAMDTLVTALGGYATNTPATKLSKIVKNLP